MGCSPSISPTTPKEQIFELLETVRRGHCSSALDSHNFTLGISACGRAKLWQEACWIFAAIPETALQPNIFSYNATMSACRKAGEWQQTMHFFQEMKGRVEPHVVSYNVAISACASGAKWQLAIGLFAAMPVAKVSPDIVTYSASITSCERFGKWQQALCLFEMMPRATIRPDVICYNAAISGCEKSGQWQEALNLFVSMQQAEILPDTISCWKVVSSMFNGCSVFMPTMPLVIVPTATILEEVFCSHHHGMIPIPQDTHHVQKVSFSATKATMLPSARMKRAVTGKTPWFYWIRCLQRNSLQMLSATMPRLAPVERLDSGKQH